MNWEPRGSREEEAPALKLAHLVQDFTSLAACFGLCALVASAVFVRWQDLPRKARWIAQDDEVAEVELLSGNAFAGEWDSYRTDFDCSRLDARQCERLQDFRSLVASRDFQQADTPPSKEMIMDQSSSTLTVRLKSGKTVKRHIYGYTLNANFNMIATAITELAVAGLAEIHRPKFGND